MNHVILTGRLVADPEVRYTQSNKAVASFKLAVDDGKNRDGKRKTQFIPCVAWEQRGELIDQYFRKGDPLTVTGKIAVRSYDKDGEKRFVTEVVVGGIEFPLTRPNRDGEPRPSAPDAFENLRDDDGDLPW